jgi:hypothetical protein
MATVRLLMALTLVSLLGGGCASYAVPGSGANLRMAGAGTPGRLANARAEQTDPSVGTMMERKPLASFPATVAIVRIQGSDYTGRTVTLYSGGGNYRVVLTHDVEKPQHLLTLSTLPQLATLEPINRLELPERVDSLDDLRTAAATLHADMVLVYTFDDQFDDRDVAAGLTLLTLGIAPTKELTVTSTASAILIDTRNGYVYGAAEAMDKKTTLANDWGETAAADACREEVESRAFEKLVGDVQGMWGTVVAQYAPAAGVPATRPAGG